MHPHMHQPMHPQLRLIVALAAICAVTAALYLATGHPGACVVLALAGASLASAALIQHYTGGLTGGLTGGPGDAP